MQVTVLLKHLKYHQALKIRYPSIINSNTDQCIATRLQDIEQEVVFLDNPASFNKGVA